MTGRTPLQGRTILAVEDEMLAAMMLQEFLQDAGANVISAGRLEQATLLARERDIDAAVLDVNLHGLRSYPVADALGARGIPFVFVSGYSERDLRKLYPDCTFIGKPYEGRELIAALAAVISAVSGIR